MTENEIPVAVLVAGLVVALVIGTCWSAMSSMRRELGEERKRAEKWRDSFHSTDDVLKKKLALSRDMREERDRYKAQVDAIRRVLNPIAQDTAQGARQVTNDFQLQAGDTIHTDDGLKLRANGPVWFDVIVDGQE